MSQQGLHRGVRSRRPGLSVVRTGGGPGITGTKPEVLFLANVSTTRTMKLLLLVSIHFGYTVYVIFLVIYKNDYLSLNKKMKKLLYRYLIWNVVSHFAFEFDFYVLSVYERCLNYKLLL